MGRLGLALAALALAGCAEMEKPRTLWATLDGNPPLVIAHRGASGYRPEHTLEAYALGIDMGADVIEPDLVFTKDGVLVARHDRYLSTTTDVADHPEFAARKRANDDPNDEPENRARIDWWVEDFTLAELKTLRARQPFPGRSKEFDGRYEIPTFDEVLALVARRSEEAGRPVGVYPETKHPGFFASKGYDFDAPLLKALDEFDAGPVFIQSFEPEILKRLKGRTSAKLVQLVYEESPGAGPNIPLTEIATYADGVGAQKELILSAEGVDTALIADAHALQLAVHPWTFRNDRPTLAVERLRESRREAEMKRIKEAQDGQRLGLVVEIPTDWNGIKAPQASSDEFEYFMAEGVDGVFTDFPDTAVAVRDEIARSTSK